MEQKAGLKRQRGVCPLPRSPRTRARRRRTVGLMHLPVVEDSADMASVLRRALREEAYDVDVAETGLDAVAAVERSAYDAILLDVMLPDIDGFEVCRRIRALGCGAPTLMLTARDRLDDRVAGLDAGADDYLTKPFDLPELFARLRALLRRGPIERPALLRGGEPSPSRCAAASSTCSST